MEQNLNNANANELKRVMLIGDSIRIGYEPYVRELLKEKVSIYAPDDNCRFAMYTLWHLYGWLEAVDFKVDIIHWNNGIWDTYSHLLGDTCIYDTNLYIETIERILQEIRRLCHNVKIIFATTTPIDDRHLYCKNSRIDEVNKKVIELMKENGVLIDDLNGALKGNPSYICDDFLHLTSEGYQKAAKSVAESIENCILKMQLGEV